MAKARERLVLLLLILVLSMNLLWIATWWPRGEDSGPGGAVTPVIEVDRRAHYQAQLHLGLQEEHGDDYTAGELSPSMEVRAYNFFFCATLN